MAKRMLIDASHPEETRVAIVSGNRLEELDYESSNKTQLKGNIYLAKVTRVEPSLQAAFVDYGGNRHGFLAFGEIHPDYYKLPVADREQLIAEEAAMDSEDGSENGESGGDKKDGRDVEVIGGDEIDEIGPGRRATHQYKIQEVIKRRQILLIQVVKEERGNKGAALTTYISLAGRYCVLMPNTARGGGVSRKITNASDRRRLKRFLEDLDIPEGMATIVRTAGAERSKAEIRRDYEYLVKTWEEIRETTLQSTAPALIHEEANLIRRSIRDLYSKDIDEILIEGADGYRTAKDFMKRLTPSHAKRVQPYKDETIPLFHRYQDENQIDNIHSPTIQLKSGGYIVINPTEALVSIDVNSGRATKERHIEETAYKTNLEAAEEIARQLRLRDLAGLIVIDFIDMEETRNQQAVERRLKDSLRADRARIQVGRISAFGLLEMSRQRLRPSLVETSMQPCSHCGGIGYIRSIESTALHVLRAIEEEGIRRRSGEIAVHVPVGVALYVLNHKRKALAEIEERYGFEVSILADDTLVPPDLRIERLRGRDDDEAEQAAESRAAVTEETGDEEDGKDRRRRRSRRRRRDKDDDRRAKSDESDKESGEENSESADAAADSDEEPQKKRRRRGRRGGRRRGRRASEETAEATESGDANEPAEAADAETDDAEKPAEGGEEDATPKKSPRRSRQRRSKRTEGATAAQSDASPEPESPPDSDGGNGASESSEAAAPSLAAHENGNGAGETPEPTGDAPAADESAASGDSAPAKRGWWQRPSS